MQTYEQIERLEKSISSGLEPKLHFDASCALKAAYMAAGEKQEAYRVARDIIRDGTQYVDELKGVREKNKMMDVLESAYITLAPDDFHSYLVALEWRRDPEKRFYLPRMSIMKEVADAWTDMFVNDKYDLILFSMPPGVGKLLADDTPVLTTDGWKRHGDLAVGDKVFNERGEAVSVLHVFPKDYANVAVSFTNGERILCHENHEWVVYDRSHSEWRVVETKYMRDSAWESGTPGTRGRRYRFQVSSHETLKTEAVDLPVDPYTFGVWLGDGTNTNPYITGDARDRAVIDGCAYAVKHEWVHKTTGVVTYDLGGDFRKDLQSIGFCHSRRRVDKHIPDVYFTASNEQRLQLLAGLIDTDGSKPSSHALTFTTSEETLRDSVVQLVSTFGWRCSVTKYEPRESSSGIRGVKPYWVVKFNPQQFVPCRLERKHVTEFGMLRMTSVCGFEEVEPVQGNCIMVEGGVYLVGHRMVPTHNSTCGIFGCSWVGFRDPEHCNLMSGYADKIVKGFYNEINSIYEDPEYNTAKIFPRLDRVSQSAKDYTMDFTNINRTATKRFQTFTCRSIDGSLTGATRCENLLYCDDLVEGIEEAMNPARLETLWQKYTNDLASRKKHGCKEIHIGTRWSVHDPIGKLEGMYGYSKRTKILKLPALDDNGKSNFDFPFGVGFSTEDFESQRDKLDDVSWKCLYQQQPIEREGLLFPSEELKRFHGCDVDFLEKQPPDDLFAFVDVAFGGNDYLSMPILAQWGDEAPMVVDWVFMKGDYKVTEPVVYGALRKWNVRRVTFEANNGGDFYAQDIQDMFDADGAKNMIFIESLRAGSDKSKMTRIVQHSPVIKDMRFLSDTAYPADGMYRNAMSNVTSFTLDGKNKNDDAPDSLAGAANMIRYGVTAKVANLSGRPNYL